MKSLKFVFPAVAALFLASGCQQKEAPKSNIRLTTTTSVRDSGLLDLLVDDFQAGSGYAVQAVAVGSGQAMQLGRMGEADILLVHSPDDEKKFVADGYGTDRVTFMHNDFVILGPASDPAKIMNAKMAAEAFRRIVEARSEFISRGDQSGTHKRELKIWEAAGIKPGGASYVESGQGMGATLTMANEKKAYLLSDRSTYLSMKKSIGLVILAEGDGLLLNRYSLILANPARFEKLNTKGARAFYDYMLSEPAEMIIEDYGVEKFGQKLFFYDYNIK